MTTRHWPTNDDPPLVWRCYARLDAREKARSIVSMVAMSWQHPKHPHGAGGWTGTFTSRLHQQHHALNETLAKCPDFLVNPAAQWATAPWTVCQSPHRSQSLNGRRETSSTPGAVMATSEPQHLSPTPAT
ncbi:hypothetical protein HaLaN_29410 [Haematococcus lacustris]|uniref:Uncharacterized protein n=1 Tax=Haematococcus lacustris TaxID=44745 RepID=A0A6A0ACQ3_HAELA|nr:hypothetical protein HaLaN_29410 [Haematococcus lacustris]